MDSYNSLLIKFHESEPTATDIALSRWSRNELKLLAKRDRNRILHLSCSNGWYDVSIRLIEEFELDPNVRDINGNTALHCAYESGNEELVVKLVSSYRCNPFLPNSKNNTPLQCYIVLKNRVMVDLLIKNCGHRLFLKRDDRCIMTTAWEHWDNEIIRCLINDGCGLCITLKYDDTTIIEQCIIKGYRDRFYFVFDNCQCDPSIRCKNGQTILHICVNYGRSDMFKYLVTNRFCKPIIKNNNGETPLHIVCWSLIKEGYSDDRCKILFYLLLDVKVSPHIKFNGSDVSVLSAVCKAITNGNHDPSMSHYITDCEYIQDEYGNTVLHKFALLGDSKRFLYLVTNHNYKPDIANNKGETPLHIICSSLVKQGYSDGWGKILFYLLMDVKVSPLIKFTGSDVSVLSAICKAITNGNHYPSILPRYIADCEYIQDEYGNTVLHKFASFGGSKTFLYLVTNHNYKPDIANNKGETPLHIICSSLVKQGYNDGWGKILFYLLMDVKVSPHIKFIGSDVSVLSAACKAITHGSYDPSILAYLIVDCGYAQDQYGDTALHKFAFMGDSRMFKYFVTNHNYKPDIANNKGETPLHIICSSLVKQGYSDGWGKIVFYLLMELKVSPHIKFNDSDISVLSAVCKAITNGNHDPSILRYLIIDCGCDPSNDSDLIINALCKIDYGLRFKHIDILYELVITKKIDPHCQTKVCILCSLKSINNTSGLYYLGYLDDYLSELIRRDSAIHMLKYNIFAMLFGYCFRNVKCECHPELIKCMNKLYSNANSLSKLHKVIITFGFAIVNQTSGDRLLDAIFLCERIQNADESVYAVYFRNPLHLARIIICCITFYSSSIYSLFYDLINSSELDLMSKADIFGNTLLHLACLFYQGDSTLIEYLLSTGKVDPLCVNDHQQTPLTLLDLSSKATNNELNIRELVAKFGETKVSHPIESYVNIIILGDPGVGKSTLVKVINDRHDVVFRQFRSVTGVELRTAGIVPHVLNDKDMGRIIVHDLAGQVEYYSSHTAVLSNLLQASAAVFVIVVSLADERSAESLKFWLSVVENTSLKASKQYHLFVVVSHYDTDVANKKAKLKVLQNILLKLECLDIICHTNIFRLDCRKLGGGKLNSLMSSLSDACESVRSDNVKKMSLYCHILYDFLQSHGKTVYSLNELVHETKNKTDCFLPTEANQLLNIIQSLSFTGLIMYLGGIDNPVDKVWIIADKSVLIQNLNGVLFAPEYFKEHVDQLVSKTGIVKLSDLSSHYNLAKYNYNPDVIVRFLESMELSHEISKDFILSSNLAPSSKSVMNERYLFIPALIINSDRPGSTDQFQFGWCLQCSDVQSFFLSLFIHLIILHLLKYTETRSPDDPIDKHCHIWNNGIYWETTTGVSVLVELFDKHKSVLLLMFFEAGFYDQMTALRKAVIGDILSCKHQVLLKTSIEEFVIDNTELQYPQILNQISNVPLYSIHEFCRCFHSGNEFVLSLNGKRKPIHALLKGANVKEQCESVLAGRNPKNLADPCPNEVISCDIEIRDSLKSSQTQQCYSSDQDEAQLFPIQSNADSRLSCSNIFNLLRDKTAWWDDIGRELGVGLNDRECLRRDVSLNDSGRLERVINLWLESSPSWDQFITALKNLQYNDIIHSITEEQCEPLSPDGQYSEISSSNLTPVSDSVDYYKPQIVPSLQSIHQAQVGLTVSSNEADLQNGSETTGREVSGACNPMHPPTVVGSPTDISVHSVLLRYRPRLLGIIGRPDMLAVELVAKGLLSPDTQDDMRAFRGTRFEKACMIINEIVRYFKQHDDDYEGFSKFCQALKDDGQPELDRLAEEMEQCIASCHSMTD